MAVSDHPHACGENLDRAARKLSRDGPSPRVWGEPDNDWTWEDGERTIPTRVGRTSFCRPAPRSIADHPHACGENLANELYPARFAGPSPRVWGELRKRIQFAGLVRTIPTRVGRTNGEKITCHFEADHPHACGENAKLVGGPAHITGPSPRVWGERRPYIDKYLKSRTIPTRVGRTAHSRAQPTGYADHPHACGENVCPHLLGIWLHGPSPRVWGELCNCVHRTESRRTIPTRVGRTQIPAPRPAAHPDHPHACGENIPIVKMRFILSGPSPRVWGELCCSSRVTA